MFTNLIPWRWLGALTLVMLLAWGLYHNGYTRGQAQAARDGELALSELRNRHEQALLAQAEEDNEALTAWQQRYQQQVVSAAEAEKRYLATLSDLRRTHQQLQRKIDDVTHRWQDERGQSHAIECVFTAGFVQQYNAAFGLSSLTADAGNAAAAARRAGGASGAGAAVDPRLRDSGVAQRDLLAHATEVGAAYQRLAAQVNGLLDYIAGLER
ncbi:hypothetical protein ACLEEB_13785 [Lonsdalea quercina]|uniref:Prophage endopeptidase n=1 Tax=Lonsdalea quercina TaxID=71657 RepID=A0A1H4EAT3_9GAMM|nr:hypothetical protein [Lonsdalea quercina]SEA81700.1 hypothetical protein SAMN02982996_02564 [Lonsdalea quercina]